MLDGRSRGVWHRDDAMRGNQRCRSGLRRTGEKRLCPRAGTRGKGQRLPRRCRCCGRRPALAPDDADVQHRLGEALLRLGALDAAIDAFRRALSVRPDFQKAANSLILALVQAGRGPEAIGARRERFIAAAPGRSRSLFHPRPGAERSGTWRSATATFRRVFDASHPGHVLARYNLALVTPARGPADGGRRRAPGERLPSIQRPEAYYTLGVIRVAPGQSGSRRIQRWARQSRPKPPGVRREPTTRSGPC